MSQQPPIPHNKPDYTYDPLTDANRDQPLLLRIRALAALEVVHLLGTDRLAQAMKLPTVGPLIALVYAWLAE